MNMTPSISDDEILYYNRTLKHIHRVHENMFVLLTKHSNTLELSFEDRRQLAQNVLNHDRSKFSVVQHRPYIELTKYYQQRKVLGNPNYEYPTQEVKDVVENAITHHYYSENHHPERHGGYVNKMSKFDIIEVCCDLQAMAQEFGEATGRKYFDNVWVKKHKNASSWEDFMCVIFTCFENRELP